MQVRHISSRRSSHGAIAVLMVVLTLVISAAAPALAAVVEEFASGSSEVTIVLEPGVPDNSSTIAFPSDSKVRAAWATLKNDQTVDYTLVEGDRGNMSAWSATPDGLDLADLDVDPLKATAFTPSELTRVSLNATDSGKTTVTGNVSAHLFVFDLLTVLGGSARDLGIVLDWTGMGIQQGTVPVDSVNLYVADFVRGVWHPWDDFQRVPSTEAHQHFVLGLGPNAGWTDGSGLMYVLATVAPLEAGGGTALTTSHVAMEVWSTKVPSDLGVDVGGDGVPEFSWNGSGVGLYGLQNVLEDGTELASVDFTTEADHSNFTSFLVPADAEMVKASVGLTGEAGEVTTTKDETTTYVDENGMSAGTNVSGIPDHADPVWAQVVLKNLKNAGMKDQRQETVTTGQIIGNFGAGSRSIAQTFQPAISGNMVFLNISLEGAVYTPAPDIVVEIRTVNVSGHPDSTVVGSSILDGATVNQSSAKWYTVFFTDVELTAGIVYAIVLSTPSAFEQTYEWKNHFQVAGDPYADGTTLVSDTIDGSGPWASIANTDQAFITYMETDIGLGVNNVKVDGMTYDSVVPGPSGDEYMFNIRGVAKDAGGVWSFSITNANGFPVSFNWSAVVHSAVYPQDINVSLSTEAGAFSFFQLLSNPIALDGVMWHDLTADLPAILAGAPTAYTAPNGVAFVRVNASAHGDVAGGMVLTGLRVRYHLPVEISGPEVTAAAEAYRAANSGLEEVEVPFVVSSSTAASVVLSDPYLQYDLVPTFTTATQILDEDTFKVLDLHTLFGDDYDNNALLYEVVSVSDEGSLTYDLDGSVLNLTPTHDFTGELEMVVRGTDSSGLFVDGTIIVVVQPVNDAPAISVASMYYVQAKSNTRIDLGTNITDVDNVPADLTLEVNTSFITILGLVLFVNFDGQGTFTVNLSVDDGALTSHADLHFTVSAAVGFPTIGGLPTEFLVNINRPSPMDLHQFGSDDKDGPGDLVWAVSEGSDLFNATLAADGFNLTITPTGIGMGLGELFLSLTDTDDHRVTRTVSVNITERYIEPPRLNLDTLPNEIELELDGASEILNLSDHVEDETPIPALLIAVTYTTDDIVYVHDENGVLTFVPKGVGHSLVGITLTDSDGLSSSFSVTVEVVEKPAEDEINWTLWILLLIVGTIIIAFLAWPRKAVTAAPMISDLEETAPKALRVEKVRPHMFRSSSLRTLEEVLLFHGSGLLLSQYTREIKEGLDADLENAVISVVQDFVKGKMRTREERTDLIELEGMLVVIERGADLAIAAVLNGREPDGLRKQLRTTLNEIQTRNGPTLAIWEGDLAVLRGVDNAMVALVEALIKGHNGSVDLSVDGESVTKPHHHPARVVEGVPPLEDDDDPLKLVRGIIGEQKAHDIEEGHSHISEEQGDIGGEAEEK